MLPVLTAGVMLAATLTSIPAASFSAPATGFNPAEVNQSVMTMLAVPAGYDGSGIRVGILDSGIAVENDASRPLDTNPCFSDAGYPPAFQVGDANYTNNKVVAARVYGAGQEPQELYPGGPIVGGTVDPEALSLHGSHVAGITACNDGTTATLGGTNFPLRGVAPRALLGNYNVFPGPEMLIGPTDDLIAQAVTDAANDGMDVLNLSLSVGRTSAPQTAKALQYAWNKGVIAVVAAGNDGPEDGTVGSPGASPLVITVGALETGWANTANIKVGKRNFPGEVGPEIEVLSEVQAPFAVAPFTSRDAAAAKKAGKSALPNPLNISTGCSKEDYKVGKVMLVARGSCPFSQKIDRAAKAGAAGVVIVNYNNDAVTPQQTGGQLAPAMIVTKSAGKVLKGFKGETALLTPAKVQRTDDAGQLAWFSSAGPTTTGLAKPDVLAPGGGILSAAAGTDCKEQAVCFAMESGTSMAAPTVAGVVALVKQAHPDWSAAMVRSAVIHTAYEIPFIPVNHQGAGQVRTPKALAANLGFDVTGVAVKKDSSVTFNVINPTGSAQEVSLAIRPATGAKLGKDAKFGVTPTVTVPAHGTAAVVVSTSGTKVGDNVMLYATGASQTIHAVVSVVK